MPRQRQSPKKGHHEHRTSYTESMKHQALKGAVGIRHVCTSTPNSLDKKHVSNMKQKLKKDIEPFGHNCEATVLKSMQVKKTPCMCIKGNLDRPSLMFKTSTMKMKMA